MTNLPSRDPHAGGLDVFTPTKGLAWFDFPSDVTRFRFRG